MFSPGLSSLNAYRQFREEIEEAQAVIRKVGEPNLIEWPNQAEVERAHLMLLLAKTRGNMSQAAKIYGTHRQCFRSRLKKHDLLPWRQRVKRGFTGR